MNSESLLVQNFRFDIVMQLHRYFFCLFAGNDLESTPIIIADTSSDESLLQMAKQAKLVLNCVGPVSEARISPQSAIICCKLFFKCLKINKSIQST